MTGIENILAFSWNKDPLNLQLAVDSALNSRTADAIADMTADVAASMFGSTSANEAEYDNEPLQDTDLEYNEPDQEESYDAEEAE